MGKISVVLRKITNLKDTDVIGKSDPYVQLQLEEDNTFVDKNYGTLRSSTKQGDLNPVYNETFDWSNVTTLKNLTLWVTVWDEDVGLDDKLGKCKVMLDELNLSSTPTDIDRVIQNKLFRRDACIFLSISYHP